MSPPLPKPGRLRLRLVDPAHFHIVVSPLFPPQTGSTYPSECSSRKSRSTVLFAHWWPVRSTIVNHNEPADTEPVVRCMISLISKNLATVDMAKTQCFGPKKARHVLSHPLIETLPRGLAASKMVHSSLLNQHWTLHRARQW